MIHGPPQVVTLTLDADEHFIDEERVAEPGVFALESFREQRTKFVAPQSHRLVTQVDASFGEQVFYVAVAEIEPMVEPDGMLNDHRRKSVPFVEIG